MTRQLLYDIQGDDEVVHWNIIFDTLSVERVEPFLLEMGLHFLDVNVIRSFARQFVKQIEEADDDLEKRKKILHQVFVKLQEETDANVSLKLYQWGKWIYTSKRHTGLFFWAILLPWLAGLYGTHVPILQPILDQKKISTIIQITHNIFADYLELEQRFEDAESLPKSRWEEYIYHKSDVEDYSPLTLASLIVTNYKAQQIWNQINSLLSEAELETFLEWARENAPRLQLVAELIKLPTSFIF